MTAQDSSVQYAYALDDQGVLTYISDARHSRTYTCPGCANPLTAVLGQINAKHFRHSEDTCAFETYLHKCAKEAFYQRYKHAINSATPIKLRLERTVFCKGPRLRFLENDTLQCQKTVPAIYDLTRIFDRAEMEKYDSVTGFRPDIMLSDSSGNRCCYVEICVSHPCTQDKIDSGIPILEFKIVSVTDIQMLYSGSYATSDERLNAYNFSAKSRVVNSCSDTCTVGCIEMSVWSLSTSGRLNEQVVPLSEVDSGTSSHANTWLKSVTMTERFKRLRTFLRSADPTSQFPNCLMCKYASEWNNGQLDCQIKGKRVLYTEARQCSVYEADV
jgi:hypothetical protein